MENSLIYTLFAVIVVMVVAIGLVPIFLICNHAQRLGRDRIRWFVASLVFTWFIVYFFLKAAGPTRDSICPKCGAPNPSRLWKCWCGYDFWTGKLKVAATEQ